MQLHHVKFGEHWTVTKEIMLLICVPLYGYWARIGLLIFICRAAIRKRVGRLKCRRLRVKSGDDPCTSGSGRPISLVGFCPVLPELTYAAQLCTVGINSHSG